MRIWLSFYEHPQGGAARTVGRMSTLNDWQLLEVCLRWHHPPPPPPPRGCWHREHMILMNSLTADDTHDDDRTESD